MDDWGDEHREGAEPTEPLPERTTPEAPGAIPVDPWYPSATWGDRPDNGAPPDGPPVGYDPNSYPPVGGYGPVGYPSGSYGAAYDPSSYPPVGYGPYGYGPIDYPQSAQGSGDNPPAGQKRSRRGRKLSALLAAVVILLGAGAGAGFAYASRHGRSSLAGLTTVPAGHSLSTAQIATAVDPAVVDIDTNLGEGTGMIATSNGEIITNNHVVDGASYIKVVVDNVGTYNATVVGTDATADVAVLQVKGVTDLPTVTFGDSSAVKIGSTVVAIGNAGGQGFPSTVTAGAVTALDRTITASGETGESETLSDVIQVDALIEPGNSGGPLVNSSGRVIGMNTAAATDEGATPIGFALPIDGVLRVANEIEHGDAGHGIVIGTVAFLGIEGETVTVQEGTLSVTGVGLEYVVPGSPADLAGIEEGDIITGFNGHATLSLPALAARIHALRPGDHATVTFANPNGEVQTVTVTLATAPPA
ncbi:MAG: trypsin-like peptidase domain-containing protein [Acidimicrobiales bacterium]|jgi:S1-C subfamily serine protease